MTTLSNTDIGAITWFAVGYGTEAGPTPTQVVVCTNLIRNGGYEGAVKGNSGYSLGVYQFDFGRRGGGQFPGGTNGLTYSQALYDAVQSWATSQGHSLTLSRDDFTAVMATHGGDQTAQINRLSGWPLEWLPQSDWNVVRDWGNSQGGREWVATYLDAPLLTEHVNGSAKYMSFGQIDGWSREDTIQYAAIMSKAVNQGGQDGVLPTRLKAYMASNPNATFTEFLGYTNGLSGTYAADARRAGEIAKLINKIEANPDMTALWSEISGKAAQSGLTVREAGLSRVFEDFFQNPERAAKFVDAYGSESGNSRFHWKQSNGDIIDGSGRDGWLLIKHPDRTMDYLVGGQLYVIDKTGTVVSDTPGSVDKQSALNALIDTINIDLNEALAAAKQALNALSDIPAATRDAFNNGLDRLAGTARGALDAIDREAADFSDRVSQALGEVSAQLDALTTGAPYDQAILSATLGLSKWLNRTADSLSKATDDAWQRLQDELDTLDLPRVRDSVQQAIADLIDNGGKRSGEAYDLIADAIDALGTRLGRAFLDGTVGISINGTGELAAVIDHLWMVAKTSGAEFCEYIIDAVATSFLSARTVAPIRRDPLILDLDGDGLETTGINPAAPILFDHDGGGVKTATGWVRSDDAFLVLDRNGNNVIDNGSELFGDATNLYTGGKAADGFAALAQEDTNHDGKVDSLDARFANLRLWRDLNQDGISQSGELFTLASQGIAALNVARTANATLLANGNQIADLGGFVRSNGTGGTLGAVEQLADINLASSPFYSQFTDSIPLTEAALNLADMQGAGMVRSLRQAASLPGAQGSALAGQLAAFAAETTRGGQWARLDPLLKA